MEGGRELELSQQITSRMCVLICNCNNNWPDLVSLRHNMLDNQNGLVLILSGGSGVCEPMINRNCQGHSYSCTRGEIQEPPLFKLLSLHSLSAKLSRSPLWQSRKDRQGRANHKIWTPLFSLCNISVGQLSKRCLIRMRKLMENLRKTQKTWEKTDRKLTIDHILVVTERS